MGDIDTPKVDLDNAFVVWDQCVQVSLFLLSVEDSVKIFLGIDPCDACPS